jgi:hypothetical protein
MHAHRGIAPPVIDEASDRNVKENTAPDGTEKCAVFCISIAHELSEAR